MISALFFNSKECLMKTITLGLFLLSLNALGAMKSYDVHMDINVNGKKIASPSVVVKDGETVTMLQDNQTIEVSMKEASLDGRKGVKMDFRVISIDDNGDRSILSKQEMLLEDNKRGTLSVKDQSNDMSISVLAKPQHYDL